MMPVTIGGNMDIPEQKYNPGQWVKFTRGNGQVISSIVSAMYDKKRGWIYTLTDPVDPNDTLFAGEGDILGVVEP
jgi:hypothetical protein